MTGQVFLPQHVSFCVERPMKRIQKIQLVALFVAMSGTALSQSHAKQAGADFSPQPVAQAAEGFSSGAFGAVRPVTPAWQNQEATLPPIVSPDGSPAAMQTKVPPIVTPDQASSIPKQMGTNPAPPIVSVIEAQRMEPITRPAPIAFVPAQRKPATRKSNGMLAPIVAAESTEVPMPEPAQMMPQAPGAIVQVSNSRQEAETGKVQQAAQWGPGAPYRNVSSGGVPIYSQDAPGIIPADISAAPSLMPPIISSDSQVVSPTPPIMSPSAVSVMPAPAIPPMVDTPIIQPSYPVIEPSYATGDSYITPPMTSAPVIMDSGYGASCSSCSDGGCSSCASPVSSCNSCGSGGCYSESTVANQFGCCGSVYSARRYLIAEALYFDREDGSISASNFGGPGAFDWDIGYRITLGRRADATSGNEFSYMGIPSLEKSRTTTDPIGRINARFTSNDGFTGVESSAFRNAVEQNQTKETGLHSLEFNRVKWGWDVIKTFVGLRYIHVDDDYRMFSRNIAGETGEFEMNALNNMFGPHIGGELFYDIGYRVSLSMFGKAGGYVNFNRVDTSLNNNGAQFIDTRDENVTLSGSLELGLIGHWQMSREARLRFGYNVLWLGEVASVSDNFSPNLSPLTGSDAGDSDDMFFHGLSVGLEVYR